jgi:hypothetical protein
MTTPTPIDVRLAQLEERQHDLMLELNSVLYDLEAIRRDFRALDEDMRELGVAVAVRVAEDQWTRLVRG